MVVGAVFAIFVRPFTAWGLRWVFSRQQRRDCGAYFGTVTTYAWAERARDMLLSRWMCPRANIVRLTYWEDIDTPSDDEIAAIAAAVLDYWRFKRDSDFWAVEAMMDATTERALGPSGWRLIQALIGAVDSTDEKLVSMIGAAPLEYYIDTLGSEAMDAIEPVAMSNPVLRDALSSVWSSDPAVGPRIERFVSAQFDPPAA